MRALFVVAAVAALALVASADLELKVDAKTNLTNADADFKFRFTNTLPLTLGAVNLFAWSSVSVDAQASEKAKADANALVSLGFLPGLVNSPFAVLVYGKGSAAVSVNINTFFTDLLAGKLEAAVSAGVVGMAALGMREVDKDGKDVGGLVTLRGVCFGKTVTGDDGNITAYTADISPAGVSSVTVTYITSKRAGIIEYGRTPISPNTFEMVIEVKGFRLSDEKNHVRMYFGLLTASGKGGIEGETQMVHAEGMDIYAGVSKYAVISGKRKEVSINMKAEAAGVGLDDWTTSNIKVAFGGKIDTKIATVDFPAGATDFVYDPAVGAGKDIYQAGASAVALSFLVALISVLVLLF